LTTLVTEFASDKIVPFGKRKSREKGREKDWEESAQLKAPRAPFAQTAEDDALKKIEQY
jgi:hypothetical protein